MARVSQAEVRQSLGIHNAHLLLNVKRLHPLAGQRFLIEAMNEVIRLLPGYTPGHLRHRRRCSKN